MAKDFASLNFDFDYRGLQRQLDDIARKALPKAAAGFLNSVAFELQASRKRHVGEAFDGHVKFTERGFMVTKAKPADEDKMFAEVFVQPKQAAYLHFQVFGGTRTHDDAGASGRDDIFVGAARTDRAGNIPKGAIKRLSARNRAEKQQRKDLRAKRVGLRATGQSVRPAMWVTVNRSKPGIFFGEIGGVRGYWERPKRTTAKGKRLRGAVTVVNRSAPKRLLTVSDSANYRPRFQYQRQIEHALQSRGGRDAFARELARALRKH